MFFLILKLLNIQILYGPLNIFVTFVVHRCNKYLSQSLSFNLKIWLEEFFKYYFYNNNYYYYIFINFTFQLLLWGFNVRISHVNLNYHFNNCSKFLSKNYLIVRNFLICLFQTICSLELIFGWINDAFMQFIW